MFSFTVIILPRGRRGHLWRGWTRACEYKHDLKLCAFNVGEKEKNIFSIWSRMIRKDLTMESALKVLIL